jgi:alkanesulfonate monooxygenase SsuD/methylene tetrahydromethanopterin reductase-like flavin-dependent oxidoreductase (luciferase family)
MAASLDVISGGRVNFGIGAGWLRPEHEAFGYPFPKTTERIEKLREAIDIINKMWTEEKPTYIGTHYKIVNAVNNPKPLQKPHPPIYIGAEHERMVKFAAEKADVWNFPSDINAYTLKEYEDRVHTLQSHCDLIGRNPNSIIKSWLGIVLLAKNEKQLNEKIKSMKSRYVSREKLLRQIVGTAKECAQKIGEYADLGVTEFILIFPEAHQTILREFSDNVMHEFGAGKASGTT